MKNKLANLFSKLPKLRYPYWQFSKLYKIYSFFRYDIIRFFRNIILFRKELLNFHSWDYSYNLSIFKRSLELTADSLEFHGNEIEESKTKKIEKIRRVIEILNSHIEDDFLELAEKELGIKYIFNGFGSVLDRPGVSRLIDIDTDEDKIHNSKISKKADEIEKATWNELFSILKGQNSKAFEEYLAKSENKNSEVLWSLWYDGSGIKGWWD